MLRLPPTERLNLSICGGRARETMSYSGVGVCVCGGVGFLPEIPIPAPPPSLHLPPLLSPLLGRSC